MRAVRPLSLLLILLMVAAGVATLAAQPRPAAAQTGTPGNPTQLTPADNGTGISTTPTFTWNAPTGAITGTTQYSIQVWSIATPATSGPGLGAFLPTFGPTTSLSYTIASGSALLAGHRYTWGIQACNGANCSGWSTHYFLFTVTGTAPLIPALSSPANNAVGTGLTPTLSWSAPSDAIAGTTTYTAVFWDPTANSGQGGLLANISAGTATSVAVPSGYGLQHVHSYTWAVWDCTSGNCSEYQTNWFILSPDPSPGAATQSAPSYGATGQSPTLTFSYSAAPHAVTGTDYYINIWDPYGGVAGHWLGTLGPATSTSLTVPAAEQLLYGQQYWWGVTACNGPSNCTADSSNWSFTTSAQPATTASGATNTDVTNGDFADAASGATSAPGWSGSFSIADDSSDFSYMHLTGTATMAASLNRDYAAQEGSGNSRSLIRVGYRLNSSPYFAVYDVTPAGTWKLLVDTTLGSGWREAVIAINDLDGASGQLEFFGTGAGTLPDIAYVQRLDGMAGRSATTSDLLTGAYRTSATDLSLQGIAGPLTFIRLYDSASITTTPSLASGGTGTLLPGALGPKWWDNWQYLLLMPTPDSTLTPTLVVPGGATIPFSQQGSGYAALSSVHLTLTQSGGNWLLKTPDQHTYTFTAFSTGGAAALRSIADRNGNTVSLAYDGSNRLSTVTDPSGRSLTLSYSGGEISQVQDSAGRSVSYGYSSGDLTSVTDVRGGGTSYTYSNNLLTKVTDQNSNAVQQASYDSTARLATLKDGIGNTTTYTYASPSAGVTKVTDARTQNQSFYLDWANRLTDRSDALAHTWSGTYDAANNFMGLTDPKSNVTGYTYDTTGNLKTVSDALSHGWTYGYDSLNDLTSTQDPNSHTASYTYDTNGNLKTAPQGLSHTITYTVNSKGQVTNTSDGRGTSISYGYDPTSGDLTSLSGAVTGSFTYDGVGNRTQMVDSSGTTTYGYDTHHTLLTSVTYPGSHTLSYGYDAAFNRTSITYLGGTNQVTYGYDADERLHTVTDWNSKVTTYGYDADSNLSSVTYPATVGITGTYSYDNADRLTGIAYTGGTGLPSVTYTLDAAGNRGTVAGSNTTTFTYDGLNRMSGASISGGASSTYTLDGAGNRSSLLVSGVGTTSYGYDTSDELTSVTPPGLGAVSNTFDANGNQTGRGSDTFTYDAQNRMTATTVGGTSSTMTYNGDGLRQSRTTGGATTNFIWDAARSLPTILDDGTQYVYGAGVGPLEHITSGGTSYYLPDALGSTMALVSGSGAVTKTYTYDPYGAVTASTGTGTDEYQFAGQETDPTGLQYLRSRYYDPSTGRFLRRDTFAAQLAQPQSVNRFAYAQGNPVTASDPTGYFLGLPSPGDVGGALKNVVDTTAAFLTNQCVDSYGDTVIGAIGLATLPLDPTPLFFLQGGASLYGTARGLEGLIQNNCG